MTAERRGDLPAGAAGSDLDGIRRPCAGWGNANATPKRRQDVACANGRAARRPRFFIRNSKYDGWRSNIGVSIVCVLALDDMSPAGGRRFTCRGGPSGFSLAARGPSVESACDIPGEPRRDAAGAQSAESVPNLPNLFVGRKARPCCPEPLAWSLSSKSFARFPGAWQGAACRGLHKRRLPREIPGGR
jgi:hypothetical protein